MKLAGVLSRIHPGVLRMNPSGAPPGHSSRALSGNAPKDTCANPSDVYSGTFPGIYS